MNPDNIKIPASWNKNQRKRFKELEKDPAVVLAYWNSDMQGFPCNGGYQKTPVYTGLIQKIRKKIMMCFSGYHAGFSPISWEGDRIWIVALKNPMQDTQEKKLVSSCREFVGEIIVKDISLSYSNTFKMFAGVDLVKNRSFEDESILYPIIKNKTISYCTFKNMNLIGGKCNSTIFNNCTFVNTTLNLNFNNVVFEGCDFINFKFTITDSRITFINCDFTKCDINNVFIKGLYGSFGEQLKFVKCKFPKKFRKKDYQQFEFIS